MHNLRELLFETLACMGGKRKKDSIQFLEKDLFIKHNKSGIKYTIYKIGLKKNNRKPLIIAYRYYGPNDNKKKFFIKISPNDFAKYSPV